MSKKEFFKVLREELKHMQKEELEIILQDYEDHFKEAKEEGRKIDEILKSLGSPKHIAKQIKAEHLVKEAEKKKTVGNITKAVLATISLGFFNVVFMSGIFIGLLGVLFGITVASLSIFASGIFVVFASLLSGVFDIVVGINPIAAILLGISITCLGILMSIGTSYIAKWFYIFTIKYLKMNIKIIKGDE